MNYKLIPYNVKSLCVIKSGLTTDLRISEDFKPGPRLFYLMFYMQIFPNYYVGNGSKKVK